MATPALMMTVRFQVVVCRRLWFLPEVPRAGAGDAGSAPTRRWRFSWRWRLLVSTIMLEDPERLAKRPRPQLEASFNNYSCLAGGPARGEDLACRPHDPLATSFGSSRTSTTLGLRYDCRLACRKSLVSRGRCAEGHWAIGHGMLRIHAQMYVLDIWSPKNDPHIPPSWEPVKLACEKYDMRSMSGHAPNTFQGRAWHPGTCCPPSVIFPRMHGIRGHNSDGKRIHSDQPR